MEAGRNCNHHAALLNRILADCGKLVATIECTTIASNPAIGYGLHVGTGCSGTATAINEVIREYRGVEGAADDVTCDFGDSLVDSADCASAVHTLNSMLVAYVASGPSAICVITTPTTTLTTSATTTAFSGNLRCVSTSTTVLIGSDDCEEDVRVLNSMLAACGSDVGSGSMKCIEEGSDLLVVFDSSGEGSCEGSAIGLNNVVSAYMSAGRFSSGSEGKVECIASSFLKDDVKCEATVAVLNQALVGFSADGEFAGCDVTTATTTMTTNTNQYGGGKHKRGRK